MSMRASLAAWAGGSEGAEYGQGACVANRMYVGNLPYSATDEQLAELFKVFGEVVEASVVRDRNSGQSKGFGFVELADEETMRRAMQSLDGTMMDGRTIHVNAADERPEREAAPHGERPERRDRPPRRDFGDDRGPRRSFDDRGPRRDFGDRPPRREYRDYDDRPPRRDYDDRPPRRDSGRNGGRDFGRDRGPRRDFGDRPPRRDFGDRRPPHRDFGGDRGPRRESPQPWQRDEGAASGWERRHTFDRAPRRERSDREDGDPRRKGARPTTRIDVTEIIEQESEE